MSFINYPNKTQPPAKPITCPRCGSKEIAFVSEYHKAWGLRIIKFILIAIIIGLLISMLPNLLEKISTQAESYGVIDNIQSGSGTPSNIEKTNPINNKIAFLIISALGLFCVETTIQRTESKTHIQCICKDCGNHWLHN